MNEIYCGNNKLISNRRGNRYECFRKGVGVGLNKKELEIYLPITKSKIYCGNKDLPTNYSKFGTPSECLQKGVGVGKKIALEAELQKLIDTIDNLLLL